jgi:hypothetical protein
MLLGKFEQIKNYDYVKRRIIELLQLINKPQGRQITLYDFLLLTGGVNMKDVYFFRSENIVKLFSELSHAPKLARDLAKVINTASKEIYPRLKRYIQKGWIQVQKINNMNIYSLTEAAKKILQL